MSLDTHRPIETPEGVELSLRIAGPVVRASAWIVDFLIRIAFYVIGGLVLPMLGNVGIGLLLILFFLTEWFYPVLFEVLRNGATPGKRMLGLQVLLDGGAPVNWSASLLRNLLRGVDFMPLAYGLGLLCMGMNRDFKRLGDLAAGTVVVYTDNLSETTRLPKAEPLPAPLPLTPEEQDAIVNFAARAESFSAERRGELASLLQPLTGQSGDAAVNHLYRIANALLGR